MPSYDYDRINLIYQPQQSFKKNQQNLAIRLFWVFILVAGLFLILFTIKDFVFQKSSKPELIKLVSHQGCNHTQYDYLQLTITWPASYCLFDKCIKKVNETWGIHGLWPNRNNGHHPAFCCPNWLLNTTKIQDLMPEINQKWFNLNAKGSENDFLGHEWSKHGTCASTNGHFNSEHKYFASGLNLYNKYPIGKWLEEAGIIPSANRTYKMDDIEHIISQHYSKKWNIGCKNYTKEKHYSLIYSFDFCINQNIEPIDCIMKEHDCAAEVSYPVPHQGFK